MDDNSLITDLFVIQFHDCEILARPYEFDSNDNPTKIIKSHTTCPECGNRVDINHTTDDNFLEKDNIRYTHCDNCGNGAYYFNSLKQWIAASVIEVKPEKTDYIPIKFDIGMMQTVSAVNWELTNKLLETIYNTKDTVINE